MDTTILQVPMTKKLREQAALAAMSQGFSSVQEAVRVFLAKLTRQELRVEFADTVKLSAKNDKRYAKMIADVRSGRAKTKTFTDVKEMMKYLNA